MSEYKYYILDNNNRNVTGVINDSGGVIKYDALCIRPIKNEFSGSMEDTLAPYYESQTREIDANKLIEEFDNIEITKDYWKAWEHASGQKRKAINTNDTTN